MRSERVSPRALRTACATIYLKKNLTHDRCIARLRTPTQKRRLRTPAQKRRLRTPEQKRRTTTPTQKVFCLLGPKPCKNCESRMSEANPRQSLVKGERLIRYELASAIPNGWKSVLETGALQAQGRGRVELRRPKVTLPEAKVPDAEVDHGTAACH